MKRKKANSAGIGMAAARAAQLAGSPAAEPPAAAPVATAAAVPGVPAAIQLPSSLTIRGVRELKKQLASSLTGGDLGLDAAAVNEVDTAGVQLLLAIRRHVVAQGGTVTWSGASELLRGAVRALGLSQELALPEGA